MSNYKQPTLTAEQMQTLAPCERYFTQAVTAAWCSYPGQENLRLMLETWKAVTGRDYVGFRPGCPDCMLNLVRDLGVIYLENKKAAAKPNEEPAQSPDKPAETPANEAEAPKPSNEPAQDKKPANGKKKGKK